MKHVSFFPATFVQNSFRPDKYLVGGARGRYPSHAWEQNKVFTQTDAVLYEFNQNWNTSTNFGKTRRSQTS